MSDSAAPAPTKRRCSPSPGSPARPRPRQWHLPGLTSFLPLPPSLPPSFPPTLLRLRSGSRLPPPCLCADLWLPPVPSRLSLGAETPSSPGQGMRGVSLVISSCYVRRWGCLRDRQEGFTVASRGPGPPPPPPRTLFPSTQSCSPPKALRRPHPHHLTSFPHPGRLVHLPAPPPARTASCPSFAWAGAPRSHLRLLLPAPAVGITPARLQLAVPRTTSRGRLEARATKSCPRPPPPPTQSPQPLLPAGALDFFFLPPSPQVSCSGLVGAGRAMFLFARCQEQAAVGNSVCRFANLAFALSNNPRSFTAGFRDKVSSRG